MFPSLAPIARSIACRVRTYTPASSGDLSRDVVLHEHLDTEFIKIFISPNILLGHDLHEAGACAVEVDTRSLGAFIECRLGRVLGVESGKNWVDLTRATEPDVIWKIRTCSSWICFILTVIGSASGTSTCRAPFVAKGALRTERKSAREGTS